MNARSTYSSSGSDRSVSAAGAMRSSILPSTPASAQARRGDGRPLLAHVAAEQVAVVGEAARDASAEYPVNVPTSTAWRAPDQPGERAS